jgi:hypothetical protein
MYDTYSTIPVNRNARKKHFRAARMGSRPSPVIPNIGDAAHAVSAAKAYKDGWESNTEKPATTIRSAWEDSAS